MWKIFLLCLCFFCLGNVCAQQIELKIVDKESAEAIPFAEVVFLNTEKIRQANIDGELTISPEEFPVRLQVRALAFENKEIEIPTPTDFVRVELKRKVEVLSEVVIKSAVIPKQLQEVPAAVNVLGAQEIERTSNFTITEVFERAPGVLVQLGALNTQKIVIRGVGSRAQYGTNRVKAYFDGIPLTTADGATTIEDLDPELINRIEIIKGPTSSIYGAGLGGVMNFYSAIAPANETSAEAKYLIGSYGLSKKTLTGSHAKEGKSFLASYNHFESNGFRENSGYDRKNLFLNAKFFLENANHFSLLATYTKLKAFIPSSLNEEDFNENPEAAASNWAAAKGYEAYDKILFGAAYLHHFSHNFRNQSSIFFNTRIADEPRPFDILNEERVSAGMRTKFNYFGNLAEIPMEASFGAEFLNEWYHISTFENLYEDSLGQGSVAGEILSNNKQQRRYLNIFAQSNFSFSEKIDLEIGMNFNTTSYSLTELYVQDALDQTGSYTFERIISPRIGLTYQFSGVKYLYASISHGFSTPNVAETLTPEGDINTNLQSETGVNYEIGLKANWLDKKLYTEIAAYSIQVKNLLVAQRVAEDQYVGVNAGETDHTGIEVLLDYTANISSEFELRPYAAAAFNFYKFDEFVEQENDFSGNELTGVPDKTITLGLDLSTNFGLSFYSSFNYVGAIPLNDENSRYTDSYKIFDLKLTQDFQLFEKLEIQLLAGINNVFNEHYATSIVTNAIGFGGTAPRYFYPGDPRNFYTGFNLSWTF